MLSARVATRAVAGVQRQQKRGIVDYLTKVPDNVMAKKKVQMTGGTLQGEANPTWMKQPGDMMTLGFGAVLTGFGLLQLTVGYYRLASGKGKYD